MAPEVPLEHTQEDIVHHARQAAEKWVLGVALTAAILAGLAAVTSLLAEHHANEAMLEQIQASDSWGYYQAKSIKARVIESRIVLLEALNRPVPKADRAKLAEYDGDQEKIRHEAEEQQEASRAHMRHHSVLSGGVTMFQVAIAVGAVAVLTRRRRFWYVAIAFGGLGTVFLALGIVLP